MKLSEIRGVDAIDVIADIIDPVTVIMADADIKEVISQKKPTLIIAKVVLKKQKRAILDILAILNNEDPKTFNPSIIELPIMLVNLINDIEGDKELMDLFHSQPQMMASVSSGAVTQNTEGTETM